MTTQVFMGALVVEVLLGRIRWWIGVGIVFAAAVVGHLNRWHERVIQRRVGQETTS